jgi:hypothetical protein
MGRRTALGFFLLMITTRLALGQVATTDLVPAAPSVTAPGQIFADANLVPDNPAAMQWGKPSRFAIGNIAAERSPLGVPTVNFDGYYAGLRYMQDTFAAGGEVVNLNGDRNLYDESDQSGAVSYQAGDIIALGAGLRNGSVSYGSRSTLTGYNLGVSLKVGETIYLGYGGGREHLKVKDATDVLQVDNTRGYTMYGAAFRSERGLRWYLGYDVIEAESRHDEFGNVFGGFKSNALTVQAIFSDILLSFSQVTRDVKESNAQLKTTVADLGYAPKKGLFAAARLINSTEYNSSGQKSAEDQMTALSIGYLF